MQMEIISNYPWYYTLLCLVAGFVFSAMLYFRDKQNEERSKSVLYGLVFLRFVSVSLIAFLLLDVFVKRLINETEKPVIIFAQDNSSSIVVGKDSQEIKATYTKEILNFINTIQKKYDVKSYQFDSELNASETFNFKGKETDISKLFKDIENNYTNKNIGAVIVASDGIYNKGTNPLYSIEKINAPIYCIGLGDTTLQKDIWIQNIQNNQIAYLGNVFPIEVVVNAKKLNGKKSNITISNNKKVLKSENISINSDSYSKTFNFVLDADKPGIQKYTVNISDIIEDSQKHNNSQTFNIDVIDNREKILILANAPHPDISAIAQSISETQTYEVEIALINDFNKPLKPYSMVIIHQGNDMPQRIINELKTNNQSVFYIGNNNTTQKIVSNTKTNETEPVLEKAFSLFTLTDEFKNGIANFPAVLCPLKNVNSYNGADILLSQKIGLVETEDPLLYFMEINGVKTGHFIGDGLWRWRMRDYLEHKNHNVFNELIHKIVQYLSVKSDKSFFRVFTKKIINENEIIDFSAEVYNQSYELITEPDVTLQLKDSNNKIYNYTFNKKQKMYSLSAGRFPNGEYTYEAKVKLGNKVFTKTGVIVIKEIISENINTVANHQLLYQISNQTGGKLFYKNELLKLQNEILSNNFIKSITYSHKELTELINLKWIFYIIIVLISTEWFIRKYNGKL